MAANSNTANGINRALDLVEDRSDGRINFIDRTWGGTVVTADGSLDALTENVADVTYVYATLIDAKFPLTSVVTQIGPVDNLWAGLAGLGEEFGKLDFVRNECGKYNALPIWVNCSPESSLLSKEELPDFASLQGKRFMSPPPMVQMFSNIGAVPVGMPPTEAYDALSKGTLDAMFYAIYYAPQWSLFDIIKHWYPNVFIGGSMNLICWNQETFNGLPDDLKAMIEDSSREQAGFMYEEIVVKSLPEILDVMIPENNVQIHQWDDAEVQKLQEIGVKPMTDEWMGKMVEKGYPDIQKYYDMWVDVNDKYEAQFADEAAKMGWETN
jgi:TRAP-type C4-dicarboxylate transport system substrate-binding protein